MSYLYIYIYTPYTAKMFTHCFK